MYLKGDDMLMAEHTITLTASEEYLAQQAAGPDPVDYDLACVPLYKEFLRESGDLKACQDEGNILDFARTLQNLVGIHTKVLVMSEEINGPGDFLIFDKLLYEVDTFMENLYKKLPKCGLV